MNVENKDPIGKVNTIERGRSLRSIKGRESFCFSNREYIYLIKKDYI